MSYPASRESSATPSTSHLDEAGPSRSALASPGGSPHLRTFPQSQLGSSSPSRGSVILYHIAIPSPSNFNPSTSPSPRGTTPPLHDPMTRSRLLQPTDNSVRSSMYSMSGSIDGSVFTTEDSKYPVGLLSNMPTLTKKGMSSPLSSPPQQGPASSAQPRMHPGTFRSSSGGIVPYEYDPETEEDPDDAYEDWLHDPNVWPYVDEDVVARPARSGRSARGARAQPPPHPARVGVADSDDPERVGYHAPTHSIPTSASILPITSHPLNDKTSAPHPYLPPYKPPRTCGTDSLRGVTSLGSLLLVVIALLSLFLVFPVTREFANNGVDAKILGNTAINSTGQAVVD
ncbi:hypothetical protein D9619_013511 [Psilocybe cf. subviscida]|uniref:Uncharacterized protein n=1 Tax=Psilocybe cf. subviscida TaxID=2480587 RepID=A0A8H5F4E8_9AGAR|nr:hypothetical protein D9619_013511 [Psilocybe cf. subviscida]